jgi:predicted aspartyl protease
MTHVTRSGSAAGGLDRRGLLRRTALVAAAGTVLPLLGASVAVASDTDPDALFTAGEFAAAGRGYTRQLRADPGNAHAAAQLGYLALLSNRFRSAERHLTEALRLAPGDTRSRARLADCFVRQDLFSRAVPLLPPPQAAQLAAVTGTPYEPHGPQVARVPFLDVDPLPQVAASVNGAAPGTFVLDTGALGLTLSTAAAATAGLRAVATTVGTINGRTVTTYLGVVPSFRLGPVELRNVPASWTDGPTLAFPNGATPNGTIGTTLFYHFLTTLDYRGRALVLRRPTAAQRQAVRAEAARAGLRPQPLWLAGDHLPCTLGKLNDYGPRVACIDSGGIATALNTSVANAERAGIPIDYAHPIPINGGTDLAYPITPDRMAIGAAAGHHLPGTVGQTPWEGMTGFNLIGNITHEFFKPFAVTFDFVDMHLYVG